MPKYILRFVAEKEFSEEMHNIINSYEKVKVLEFEPWMYLIETTEKVKNELEKELKDEWKIYEEKAYKQND